MRMSLPRFLACAALTLATAAAAQADSNPGAAPWAGTWTNMNNTMHVRAGRCGNAMCGVVIWADGKTQAAAKNGKLIGTQVFRDFVQTSGNEWKGRVYVPALDQMISGKIVLTDNDSITASGCAFGFVGCQTRHWKRIR